MLQRIDRLRPFICSIAWTSTITLVISFLGPDTVVACQGQLANPPSWSGFTAIENIEDCNASPCSTVVLRSVPDACGNTITVVCKAHILILHPICRYKHKYNGSTKGSCVYHNGQNAWGHKKDGDGCFSWVKHVSADPDNSGPGDEGEVGYYDWVVNNYDATNNVTYDGNCRHGDNWADARAGSETAGEDSDCE